MTRNPDYEQQIKEKSRSPSPGRNFIKENKHVKDKVRSPSSSLSSKSPDFKVKKSEKCYQRLDINFDKKGNKYFTTGTLHQNKVEEEISSFCKGYQKYEDKRASPDKESRPFTLSKSNYTQKWEKVVKLIDVKKRDQSKSKSKDKEKKRDKSAEEKRKLMKNIGGAERTIFGNLGKSKSNMILKNEDKMPKLQDLKI